MAPGPSSLLVLVLCLGQTIHMQGGALPKPTIRAEPGPVFRWGQPVTIVCGGPAWADAFRLEKENRRLLHKDQKNLSPRGSHWVEIRFHVNAENEFTAGRYFCHYHKGHSWSEHSETLELKVADKDISTPPSGLSPEHVYILIGTCAAFLLCLLLLILLLVHRQRQKRRGPPSSKGEEPRPQERLSPTVDITESTADVATTVETLSGENRDMQSPSPAAEDPEEVTYAQLDQRALTRRAARAESPQPTEPTADSSMYAALPPH